MTDLEKGAVGFRELLGQSIALIAPLGAVAATLTGAAQFALGPLPLPNRKFWSTILDKRTIPFLKKDR